MKDGKLTSSFQRWSLGFFLVPFGTALLAYVVAPIHPILSLLVLGGVLVSVILLMLKTGTAWAVGTRMRLVERSREPWRFWLSFIWIVLLFAFFAVGVWLNA